MQALSALSCWYFFFYALYFMAFHLLYLRLRDGRWPRGWPLAAPLFAPAGAAAAAVALAGPDAGGRVCNRSVYYVGNNMFVADLAGPGRLSAHPSAGHYGSGIYAALTGNAWEGAVYLGLVNLAVLAWALTRKNDKTPAALCAGRHDFLRSSSPAAKRCMSAGHVTPLHLPGVILAKLPFFANVRTPARAMVMVYLFLGLALAQAT